MRGYGINRVLYHETIKEAHKQKEENKSEKVIITTIIALIGTVILLAI